MTHKMLKGQCPEKLKNQFTSGYSGFSIFAKRKYFPHIKFSRSTKRENEILAHRQCSTQFGCAKSRCAQKCHLDVPAILFSVANAGSYAFTGATDFDVGDF